MTVVLNRKLDIRKLVISKINQMIFTYLTALEVDAIHFDYPIDGIKFYHIYPHYDEFRFESGWYATSIKASTLLKVLKCLKNKEFHAFVKTTNHKLIKIRPRKNVGK